MSIPTLLNYDTLISEKVVTGRHAELYAIAAEYRLDGVRLGGVEFEMASESVHDGRLSPKREEVESAARILARSGYVDVHIITVDSAGRPLERPDVDVVVDGKQWGFEIARGIDATRAKESVEEERVVIAVRDLLDADPQFSGALGPVHLHVMLESDDQPLTRNIGKKIVEELQRFILAGSHLKPSNDGFGRDYPVLRGRGASYRLGRDGVPYITVSHGRSIVDPRSRRSVVLETLNRHRTSAATYRHARNWCAIWITDGLDLFRDTLSDLALAPPPISPFERAFVTNVTGRMLALEAHAGTVTSEEVPY